MSKKTERENLLVECLELEHFMEFDDIFDPIVEVHFQYQGATTICTYHEPGEDEWIEYQRRALNLMMKRSRAETVDFLGARLWLHNKLRDKVDVVTPAGERQEIEDEFPPEIADQIICGFLNRIQPAGLEYPATVK